jgi:hypothetical protein
MHCGDMGDEMDKGWMKQTKKQDCDGRRWGKEENGEKAVRTMSRDETIASLRDGKGMTVRVDRDSK